MPEITNPFTALGFGSVFIGVESLLHARGEWPWCHFVLQLGDTETAADASLHTHHAERMNSRVPAIAFKIGNSEEFPSVLCCTGQDGLHMPRASEVPAAPI